MLKIERHEAILRLLNEKPSLLVSDACELLGCSDQTIRRDFQELEEQGKLKRIHGGAFIPAAEDKGVPVKLRAGLIIKEKQRMAQLAASSFIKGGDVIMLDSSTTCGTLARHIISLGIGVTMITNSLAIVSEFETASPAADLICIGGRLNERSGAFVGARAIESVSSYVADKAFISCNAISSRYGMIENFEAQRDIRKAMLDHSKQRYLLVDHTKFDDEGSFRIDDFSALDAVITDREPGEEWRKLFADLGISVIW